MLKSGFIYLAANVASSAVPFFLLPVLTRALAPEAFGAIVGFSLVATIVAPIAGLNAHGAVGVAWFNRDREHLPSYVGAAVLVAFTSTAVWAAIAAFVVSQTPIVDAVPAEWAAAAVVMAGAQVVLQMRLVLWQSQKRPMPVATMQFAGSIVHIGLALVAVLVLGLEAPGRNGAAVVAAVLFAVLGVAALAWDGNLTLRVRRDDIFGVVRFGGLLVPHALGGALTVTVDRVVVAACLGPDALGTYGAAAQLGAVVAIAADAFGKAYSPWLFERLAADDESERLVAVGAMYALAPLAIPAGGVAAVALTALSSVVLGPEYGAAAELLPWFIVGGVATIIYLLVSPLFFFHDRTARLSSTTLPCAAVGALCTFALARIDGARGAAAGFALTQTLLTTGVWVVAFHTFDLPWRKPYLALRTCWRLLRNVDAKP